DHARHAYHRHHGGAAAQAGRQQRPQGFHKLLQSLAHGEDIGPISAPLKRCRTTEDGGQTTEDGSTRGRGYPSSVFRRLSSVLRLTNSVLSRIQTFYHMIDPIRRISPWVQGSCVRSLPSPSLLPVRPRLARARLRLPSPGARSRFSPAAASGAWSTRSTRSTACSRSPPGTPAAPKQNPRMRKFPPARPGTHKPSRWSTTPAL